MLKRWIAVLCSAALLPAASAQAGPADDLEAAVEQVPAPGATARYDARDDRGSGLDGLKVIESDGRYVGVHHSTVGGRLQVRVASSSDLTSWQHAAVLETDAAQPTIAAFPGGGYIVAYEKGRPPIVPLPAEADRLLAPVALVQRLGRGTVRLRFRHYRSAADLLAGRHTRQFTAPLTLSPTAEGTPSIERIETTGGLGGSRISVGLHYFADLNGDSYPEVDRQAAGVLTGFSSWKARRDHDLDDAFLELSELHAGFTRSPEGHIGDRDHLVLDGARLALHEAQYERDAWETWRPFLVEHGDGGVTVEPLEVVTAGGSTSFGNPTVTLLRSPDGDPALFVSLFVFSEGAAAGESGALLYYREREP